MMFMRTFLVVPIFTLGLAVSSTSNAGEADSDFSSFDIQQRLLAGGGHYIVSDEHSFADELAQSSRRTQYAVECPVPLGQVDYFDISAQLTPQVGWNVTCPLADQIMLGHDINAILLNHGVGDAGVNDDAIFIAGVCAVPKNNHESTLGDCRLICMERNWGLPSYDVYP